MLRIFLLGRFRVESDGQPIDEAAWPRRNARNLLKLLALQPRRQMLKEQAIDVLWSESKSKGSPGNLYRVLHILRHALEPDLTHPAESRYVTLAGQILRLGPPKEIWVDVDAFEDLLAAAEKAVDPIPLLEEAISLYAGDLLEENLYDEWTQSRRASLRNACDEALIKLGQYQRQRQHYEASITALLRALQSDPSKELAHRELMLTYTLAGRSSDALRQYQLCKQELAQAYGAEPLAETTELYTRIITGSVAAARPAGKPKIATPTQHDSNVPAPMGALIGRESELAAVCDLLRRPMVRLLTLTGAPGVGKTRLSIQVAHRMVDAFPDGVVFIRLAPISEPQLIVATIAQHIGVAEISGQPLIETLKRSMHGRRMLLLLDNFEHVTAAAADVVDLLAANPELKALVTSRKLLDVYGETSFIVPPLALPDINLLNTVQQLAQYSAIQLFVERAQAVWQDFILTSSNALAITEICWRLDGIPLALELAAARVRVLPPSALLERLSSRLSLLTSGPRTLPARHQTLRGTIDWSYGLLSQAEQELFAQLAVFVGGCSLEAIEAVAHSRTDTLDNVQSLLNQHLLQRVEQNGAPRFMMLEMIHEYALEQLGQASEGGHVRQRHAAYYLGLAESAVNHEHAASKYGPIMLLDRELANVQEALLWHFSTWTGEREVGPFAMSGVMYSEPALRALYHHWHFHGYWSQGRVWLEIAQAQCEQTGHPLLCQVLAYSGYFALLQGALDEVATLAAESIRLARAQGERRSLALALQTQAQMARIQDDRKRARELFEEGLQVLQGVDDQPQTIESLLYYGWLLADLEEYTGAQRISDQLLGLGRRHNLHYAISQALALSAYVLEKQGDLKAQTLYREALTIAQGDQDQRTMAFALLGLGTCARLAGDFITAVTYYKDSLALWQQLENKHERSLVINSLGNASLRQGDTASASAYFAEGLRISEELDSQRGIAESLGGLAAVAAANGQLPQAARLFGASDTLLASVGAVLDLVDQLDHDYYVDAARAQLGVERYATEWEAGRVMGQAEAIRYALFDVPGINRMSKFRAVGEEEGP